MKVASKLAILFGLGVSVASFASAKSLEQTYLDNCRKDPAIPVPVAVVSPHAASEYVGTSAEVEFTVDSLGKPSGFAVRNTTDRGFAEAVIEAVRQWKFTPAHKDGVPVSTKVVLPVRVVDVAGGGYAAN